jgi:hypothetical protein
MDMRQQGRWELHGSEETDYFKRNCHRMVGSHHGCRLRCNAWVFGDAIARDQ